MPRAAIVDTGPLFTCEAVVAEALYLLRSLRPAQDKILEWIEGGVLECHWCHWGRTPITPPE